MCGDLNYSFSHVIHYRIDKKRTLLPFSLCNRGLMTHEYVKKLSLSTGTTESRVLTIKLKPIDIFTAKCENGDIQFCVCNSRFWKGLPHTPGWGNMFKKRPHRSKPLGLRVGVYAVLDDVVLLVK